MKAASSRFGLWAGALGVVVLIFFVIIKMAGSGSVEGSADAVAEDDWTLGGLDAPVTLIEYSDFQCPACKVYHPILLRLRSEFGDSLRFVYRHFPLRQLHPNAAGAAQAAEAAGVQGKFWEMHDLLFDRQTSWEHLDDPADTFASYAAELGLNTEQFRSDFASDAVRERVQMDEASGTRARVSGTPTLFLNGARVENIQTYDDLRALVIQAGGTVKTTSVQTKSAE